MFRDPIHLPRFLIIGTPRCGMHFVVNAIQRATLGKLVMMHEVCFTRERVRYNPMFPCPWAEGSYAALKAIEDTISSTHPVAGLRVGDTMPHVLHLVREKEAVKRSLVRNGYTAKTDAHGAFILGQKRLEEWHGDEESIAEAMYCEWNERCAKVSNETVNIENVTVEWLQDFLCRMKIECEVRQEHLDLATRSDSSFTDNRLGVIEFRNKRPSIEEMSEIALGKVMENFQC